MVAKIQYLPWCAAHTLCMSDMQMQASQTREARSQSVYLIFGLFDVCFQRRH